MIAPSEMVLGGSEVLRGMAMPQKQIAMHAKMVSPVGIFWVFWDS
jgi:hypothetical protein